MVISEEGQEWSGEVDFKGTVNLFFKNWMLSPLVFTAQLFFVSQIHFECLITNTSKRR